MRRLRGAARRARRESARTSVRARREPERAHEPLASTTDRCPRSVRASTPRAARRPIGTSCSTYEQSTRIPLACTYGEHNPRARCLWTSRFDRLPRSRPPTAPRIEVSRGSHAVPFRGSPISPWCSWWPAAPSWALHPPTSLPAAAGWFAHSSGSTGFASTTFRALSRR